MTKKIYYFLILMLFLTSCKDPIGGRYEINDLKFVHVLGIDSIPNSGLIKLTVISKSSALKGGNDSSEQSHILTTEGETIFDAARKLNQFSTQKLFWGHAKFILFGSEAAKNNIVKYFDFFSREAQFRLNSNVFVVANSTAEDLIQSTSTQADFISDRLQYLINNHKDVSLSHDIELSEILTMFERPHIGKLIPTIYKTNIIRKTEKDAKKSDIELNGFAIFKDNDLSGYLKDQLALGTNWIRDRFDSGIYVVNDLSGGKVSLEIIDASTKITPTYDGNDKLSIFIKIRTKANVGEVLLNTDIFSYKSYDFMNQQLEGAIKKQCEIALQYAKSTDTDFLEIWNAVYHKYPKQSKSLKKNWPKIFSTIPVRIEVSSSIKKSYILNEPAQTKLEEVY